MLVKHFYSDSSTLWIYVLLEQGDNSFPDIKKTCEYLQDCVECDGCPGCFEYLNHIEDAFFKYYYKKLKPASDISNIFRENTFGQALLIDKNNVIKDHVHQQDALKTQVSDSEGHLQYICHYGLYGLFWKVGQHEEVYKGKGIPKPVIDWNNAAIVFKITNAYPATTRCHKMPGIVSLEEAIHVLRRQLFIEYADKSSALDRNWDKLNFQFFVNVIEKLPQAFDKVVATGKRERKKINYSV